MSGPPETERHLRRRPPRKRRLSARTSDDEAAGTGSRGRSARRKPNPLFSTVRRSPGLRAKEPRREFARQRCLAETRTGNPAKLQGFGGNPVREPGKAARPDLEPKGPTGAARLRPEPFLSEAPGPHRPGSGTRESGGWRQRQPPLLLRGGHGSGLAPAADLRRRRRLRIPDALPVPARRPVPLPWLFGLRRNFRPATPPPPWLFRRRPDIARPRVRRGGAEAGA